MASEEIDSSSENSEPQTVANPAQLPHYRAFISYRQVDPDREVAQILLEELERYRLPKGLSLEGSRQIGKVFLDRHEMAAGSLSASITEALERSDYLIVVCSEKTPESDWIAAEVREFLRIQARRDPEARPLDHVLVVSLGGTPKKTYPEPLLEAMRREQGKESFLDGSRPDKTWDHFGPEVRTDSVRAMRKDIRDDAVLRLVAAMLEDCTLDSLKQRRKVQRRKRRNRVLVAGALLALLTVALFWLSRSDPWQVWWALRQAPVEDAAVETTLYSWVSDAALYQWMEAVVCAGHPEQTSRALAAVDEEILRHQVAATVYCLYPKQDPGRTSAHRRLLGTLQDLPDSTEDLWAFGLGTDAVVEAIDSLARCDAEREHLEPLVSVAEERLQRQQVQVDPSWIDNAVTDAIRLAQVLRTVGDVSRAAQLLDQRLDHLRSLPGEIGLETELAVRAERLRAALAEKRRDQAEELWQEILDQAGTFESQFALDWDELYGEVARFLLAQGEIDRAFRSAQELRRPVERATAQRILFAELTAKEHPAAVEAWTRLLASDPRLDSDVYDLPEELLSWREALSHLAMQPGVSIEDFALPESGTERIRALTLLGEATQRPQLVEQALQASHDLDETRARCGLEAEAAAVLSRIGETEMARSHLVDAVSALGPDPADRSHCWTRFAEAWEELDPDQASEAWGRAFDEATRLNPDHAEFSPAVLGYHRDVALRGDIESGLSHLSSLPPQRGWELAATVAEFLDHAGRAETADAYWDLSRRRVASTTGELQRDTNRAVLAQALARRGDLRQARLLCGDCASDEKLTTLAAVVASASDTCPDFRFQTMIEWLEP